MISAKVICQCGNFTKTVKVVEINVFYAWIDDYGNYVVPTQWKMGTL